MKTKPEGARYGHLMVIEHHHTHIAGHFEFELVRMMLCKCDCGREKIISEFRLIHGLETNCGCGL